MSHRVNSHFVDELKQYGPVNIESCFNCGNCTAVCPLSTETDNFPRRMIRYTQIGLKEKLLSSKELWLCYHCGECTTTCPRQADPGEFMAAARRYAIAQYDRSGLSKFLFTSSAFHILFLILLTAVLGVFIYSFHGPMREDILRLFDFIPSQGIHDAGVIAGIILMMITLMGLFNMILHIKGKNKIFVGAPAHWIQAVWKAMGNEVLGQRNYRKDCERYSQNQRWYMQKWFIHASMLWGFLGLFLATGLDYLLEILGGKAVGTWVPIWYPIRLLGTCAGIFLLYGTSAIIFKRLIKADEASAHSTTSDWIFLLLLWSSGITGFLVELSLYLPQPAAWNYWMLFAHLVVVGDLLLLFPFSKFSHAIYRTAAIFIQHLKSIPDIDHAAS